MRWITIDPGSVRAPDEYARGTPKLGRPSLDDPNACSGTCIVTSMEFQTDWPVILVGLAVVIIATGLIRKLAKLAFVGVALGAIGLFIWQSLGTP